LESESIHVFKSGHFHGCSPYQLVSLRQKFNANLVVVGAKAALFNRCLGSFRCGSDEKRECNQGCKKRGRTQRSMCRSSVAKFQVGSPGEHNTSYDVNFPAKDAVPTRVSKMFAKNVQLLSACFELRHPALSDCKLDVRAGLNQINSLVPTLLVSSPRENDQGKK
jgi:hypothetical protein